MQLPRDLARRLAAAGITVVTVSSLTTALLPSSDGTADPARVEHGYHSQYKEARSRELRAQRLRANTLGDAVNADHLRSSELRSAEKAADDVLRAAIRSR